MGDVTVLLLYRITNRWDYMAAIKLGEIRNSGWRDSVLHIVDDESKLVVKRRPCQ